MVGTTLHILLFAWVTQFMLDEDTCSIIQLSKTNQQGLELSVSGPEYINIILSS